MMDVISINPANQIIFKIPNELNYKFKVQNLTLRYLCIYIISLHPNLISIDVNKEIIGPFQDVQVNTLLHWSQEINCIFNSKIRIYIWELYDDQQTITKVLSKMFNSESNRNQLYFEDLNIQVEIDSKYLQKINSGLPMGYQISRAMLPNNSVVMVNEEMMSKTINHCQQIGKIKAIYTYEQKYVVQFCQTEDILCSFCEVMDNENRLSVFGIACIPNFGNIIYSPDILILTDMNIQSSKQILKKQRAPIKQLQQKEDEEQVIKNIMLQKNEQKITAQKQQNNEQNNEHNNQYDIKQNNIINNNRYKQHKQIVKQSMFQIEKNKGWDKKKSKSEEFIVSCELDNNMVGQGDGKVFKQVKVKENLQRKNSEMFQEKFVHFSKKILNIALSPDQKFLYVLFKDCVVVCQTENIGNNRSIKFDPIDDENINLPTPMILFIKQKTLIFANDSYIFWLNLLGEQIPQWKYVQRKQIYTIQIVQQLNLLIVGGKNFSKLSYFGKSTNRSNIKIYSCGKYGKRDHLFTYDIPQCNGQNVIQLKYIVTKPNGTKLLLVLTNHSKLYFLRIKAFNIIQMYSSFNSVEIGIQDIVSINYHTASSILICMEKLSEEQLCLKYIKASCTYEKVQIFTQSVKLPVVKYLHHFRMGGRQGSEWLTVIDAKNSIYSLYLQWKQPKIAEYKKQIKDCLLMKKGAIFRENAQIMSRILKN